MAQFRFNLIVLTVSIITILVLALSLLDKTYFDLLTTSPRIMSHHEYWRWLTCNFVHFGWAHSIIDILGFLLVSLALFYQVSVKKFLGLLLFCSLAVGIFISILSPEVLYYAGLSGAIHGLFIAGCFYARDFPVWKRAIVFIITTGKIIQEQLPGYDTNPLHNLMPVAVAIDAHLIGAIAGLVFFLLDKFYMQLLHRQKRLIRN
jgi:rhomboid family GlyGly-CTERM serine protease